MIAALIYLQYHSVRNRLVMRFKRLKHPKYLIGAIAGGLYFYFYFFRYLFNRGNSQGGVTIPPEYQPLVESLGALLLLVIILLGWIIPHGRAALTFTEAEVAFLFPAPVTRRTLVHFKLLRSQLAIFFSSVLLTLFSRRFGGNLWTHALGWWLILSTLNLHFLGSSFARTMLLDRGISNRLRRLLVLALAATLTASIWLWARNALPPMPAADAADMDALLNYTQQVLTSGPAMLLLYPFRLLAQPFLAPDWPAFFYALGPALLLLVLHYVWVIFADVAFEEASVEASQKLAVRIAAARAGNWQSAQKAPKARREWFQLAPTGPPAKAILWKNLIGVGQVFSARLWIILLILCIAVIAGFGGAARSQALSTFGAVIISILLGYSLLIGPQLLRLDFRQDLPQADLLKTYPLRGWQIALGEILAPVIVLAALQWVLLLLGLALVLFLPGNHTTLLLAVGLAAACVLPVLDFLLLLIPNFALLLFPSWVQAGKDGPRGVEATGQRLILAIGQMLVLLLTLVPAALAFVAVYFSLKLILGPIVPVPFAALAAAIVVGAEVVFGLRLLGRVFERFDVTEEPTN